MSHSSEEDIKEFVRVLRDIRRRLISASILRASIVYISWSLIVTGFIVLISLFEYVIGMKLPDYAVILYWVIAALIITFIVKYEVEESRLLDLEIKLRSNAEAVKGRRRRVGLLITITWVASFIIAFLLYPQLIFLCMAKTSPEFIAASGILLAIGLGNLGMFVVMATYLRRHDEILLLGTCVLFAFTALEFMLKSGYWPFTAIAIIFAYNLMGLMYLIRSFRVITTKE